MRNHLIPALLLVLPAALVRGFRPKLFRGRAARWLVGGACVLAIGLSLPYEGLDFSQLKRIKLLLAAATAVLCRDGICTQLGRPPCFNSG